MDRPDPGAELVEVVDVEGRVLCTATRAEVRRRRLRHRCTYVVVRNDADEVLVHRRAGWKDVYPGWWDLAFGGVCAVGEGWLEAARRELAEEAGLTADLVELGAVGYDGDDGRIVGRVYLARHGGPARCDDGEVVEVAWVPRADLGAWVAGRPVCRDSVAVVLPRVLALT